MSNINNSDKQSHHEALSAQHAVQLAEEIAEVPADATVNKIVDVVRNRLQEEAVMVTYPAHKFAIRKGLLFSDALWEEKFMSQAHQSLSAENYASFVEAAKEAKEKGEGLEMLVGLSEARKYLDPEIKNQNLEDLTDEDKSSDEEKWNIMNMLKPQLFALKRPLNKDQTRSTDLEQILAVNPKLTINQIVNVIAYLQEEEIRKQWQKQQKRAFDDLSSGEYTEFKAQIASDELLSKLERKLSEYIAVANYQASIDATKLAAPQKEKLKEMMTLANYQEAIATALEIDPSLEIKPIKEVIEKFLKLDESILKEIAEFKQPTLLIVPNNSFEEKVKNMNGNKKYVNEEGEIQEDVYIDTYSDSPYATVGKRQKTAISMVDGQPHMPHIAGIAPNSRWNERKAAFKKHFTSKGMRLINIHEAAVLEQQGLRAFNQNGNDVSKIIDYIEGNNSDTYSCLDDECLTSSSVVACSYFSAYRRRVNFYYINPADTDGSLRGRPAVQFFEY